MRNHQRIPTTIRFVIANAPGGGLDITARITGPVLSAAFGQQMIYDNRGGAAIRIPTYGAGASQSGEGAPFSGNNCTPVAGFAVAADDRGIGLSGLRDR